MRRNTRIANTYVAATLDGSGMNKDIVDAVDDASDGVGKSGDKAGQDYGDNFSEGFLARLDGIADRVSEQLGKRLGRSLGTSLTKNFNARGAGSLGERIGATIGEAVSDRLEQAIANQMDLAEDRIKSLMSVSGNGGSGGPGSGSGAGSNAPGSPQTLYKSYDFYSLFETARAKMHARANDTILKDDRALVKSQEALLKRLTSENEKMWAIRRASAAAYIKYEADLERGLIDERANRVRRGSDGPDFATRIGKLLGAGSRNNALNLMGRSMAGIIRLTTTLGSVSGKAFSTFSQGAAQAAEGAGLLSRMGAGFGAVFTKGLGSVAASGPGAAIAIGVVVAAMAVLVSVMGAVMALAVALSATIVSGLTAAALVGAGAFTAMAAAGGLLAVAFTSMTDAQKTLLSDAFMPFKEALTGLGQLMITQMVDYFPTWSANLQRALVPLAPLAQVMGRAFGEAGNALTAAFAGPGFQRMAAALGTYLPGIVTRLSAALGSFLNGTMGLFAALMPLVNRFAGYLQNVAARFSNWANSAEGQNAIVDFAERAVDSLLSLWDATREIMGFLTDLLFSPEAQAAGNTIFDGIANAFENFREKINNGDLEKWFNDAIAFGSSLWGVMQALGQTFVNLYNSGVLEAIGSGFNTFASILDALNVVLGPLIDILGYVLPVAMASAVTPILIMATAIVALGEAIKEIGSLVGIGDGGSFDPIMDQIDKIKGMWTGAFTRPESLVSTFTPTTIELPELNTGNFSLPDLTSLGSTALNATSVSNGGYKPDPVKKNPEYKNPYVAFAESLIQQGPTAAQAIRDAMKQINKQINGAIKDAAKAATLDEAQSGLTSMVESLWSDGQQGVDQARSNLSSAATRLANAGSAKEAKRALKEVKAAQRELSAALAQQGKLQAAAKALSAQRMVNWGSIDALINGVVTANTTLADFAVARERLAERLEAANEQLLAAIALRNDYYKAVADSTRAFGSLMTATAQSINGVQQALTAGDIVGNMRSRLAKIQEFQNNLRILLARGLSNEAYKQLVDAGVEEGGTFAAALVQGGAAAVSEVNGLTEQINYASEVLGAESANRLYQAGVDSAQGLIDGLKSQETQLAAAAYRLGQIISWEIQRAMGIASPSKVAYNLMGDVGDGMVGGLYAQHDKVGTAASALAGRVAVSPEVAAYAARQNGGVSGNSDDPRFRDLHVHTPTTKPEAVAMEVLNEVTGRL